MGEKEYVEREVVLSEFEKEFSIQLQGFGTHAEKIMTIYDNIKSSQAADVVEVRRGVWEWYVEPRYDLYSCDENFGYRCSECHVWAGEYGVDDDIYEEPPTHILHYCPNCGAKMDGKGEGE